MISPAAGALPVPSSPPILADKDTEEPSVFTPQGLLREARRQKGLPVAEVPDVCVLDPDGDLVRYLVRSGRAVRAITWACYHTDLHILDEDGLRLGLVAGAVGASFAVLVAEELFASGCRVLLSVTSAGRVAEPDGPASFVLIDRALRDEGTSYHYLPPARYSEADPALLSRAVAGLESAGIGFLRGSAWTTDAPFRETRSAIATRKAEGILAVEMEAAALYAFARARGEAVLCFAHLTNQMALVEGDFEKGPNDGAIGALALVTSVARAVGSSARPVSPARETMTLDDARSRLFERLRQMGIDVDIVPYPEAATVEEGKRLRGLMAGTFTKNLLLRDKKGALFLVAAHEDRAIDLRTLHTLVGASGRLGFAPAERMSEVLGVTPGGLTPLAIINDHDGLVSVVLDASLLESEQVNFHPLHNSESIGLPPDRLIAFIRSCGRDPIVVALDTAPVITTPG